MVLDAAGQRPPVILTKQTATIGALSADGKRLLAWNRSSHGLWVKSWALPSGEEIFHREFVQKLPSVAIMTSVFRPDGRQVAFAFPDHSIEIWDATSGGVVHRLRGHTGTVGTLAFSADGQRLASTGDDRLVKIWDTHTGRELLSLTIHDSQSLRASQLAFSADGHRLCARTSGHLLVWDATPADQQLLQLVLPPTK